ncbi:hypothetical protein [Aestuariirhabdus litorea]|uniref:Uncharacterized protein n=1 Tax=Aestuariirhabdus litorea TaxID=2528527 RepID=A0A3P3VLN3_9GAMM|nr:hypothetical protein [Aestuariirhabdus litorea]RRJ82788.1 hypothetical protein D0544_13105 [Aestuariirhabdus litorea]RWW92947.1 hypothetical protein DZC74_13080 [Endozoicomonadaceae bacterium GTF-13]
MKKLIILSMSLILSTPTMADADKGQKYYLKYLRPYFDYNGQVFATQKTQNEWKEDFKEDAKIFIKEFSKKHPNAEEFLNGAKFQKMAPHIGDFAIKYASDSGQLPNCN